MTWDAKGSHPTLLLDSPQGVLSSSLEAAGPLAHRGPGGFPARPGRAEGRGCRDLWGLSVCVSCSRPALSFPPACRVLVSSRPCPHLCCFCPLSVSPLGCLMATQPLAGCQALSRHHLKNTSGSTSKEQGFHPDTWEGDGRREVGCTWQSQAALGRPRKWLSSCSADLADSLDRTPAPSPQPRWVDSLLSGMWWRPCSWGQGSQPSPLTGVLHVLWAGDRAWATYGDISVPPLLCIRAQATPSSTLCFLGYHPRLPIQGEGRSFGIQPPKALSKGGGGGSMAGGVGTGHPSLSMLAPSSRLGVSAVPLSGCPQCVPVQVATSMDFGLGAILNPSLSSY